MYGLLADAVVVLHFAFIVFVTCGAFLVIAYEKVAWIHIPALIWGAMTEFFGLICPLTPLENYLRSLSTSDGYSGDFIAYYLLPIIYPGGLTREIQWLLGAVLILINLGIYGYIWRRRYRLK